MISLNRFIVFLSGTAIATTAMVANPSTLEEYEDLSRAIDNSASTVTDISTSLGIENSANKSTPTFSSSFFITAHQQPVPFAVPLTNSFLAVADVPCSTTDQSLVNLKSELKWFKTQGFDTVVMVWRGESWKEVCPAYFHIRKQGWKVALAVDSDDFDPNVLSEVASKMKPDYFISGWRKSSDHEGGSEPIRRAIINTVRSEVPEIPVIGGGYYDIEHGVFSKPSSYDSATMLLNIDADPSSVANLASSQQIHTPFVFVSFYGPMSKRIFRAKQALGSGAYAGSVVVAGDGSRERDSLAVTRNAGN